MPAAFSITPTGSITSSLIENIVQTNYKEMNAHMNQEKKTLEITGLPLVPLSVGRSAYIFESDGTRRTSRVLAIQHSSQTEIDFETLNTHYLLHVREIGGRT